MIVVREIKPFERSIRHCEICGKSIGPYTDQEWDEGDGACADCAAEYVAACNGAEADCFADGWE